MTVGNTESIESQLRVIERTLGNVNTNEEVQEVRDAVDKIRHSLGEETFLRPQNHDNTWSNPEKLLFQQTQDAGEITAYRILHEQPRFSTVNTVVDLRFRAGLNETLLTDVYAIREQKDLSL